MDTTKFQELDLQLVKEGEEGDAAQKLIQGFFVNQKAPEISEEEIAAHFLVKKFDHPDVLPNDKTMSPHALEEMFFEVTIKALFAQYQGKDDIAKNLFAEAETVSKQLKNKFITQQLTFLKSLQGDNLKKKLMCDVCFDNVNRIFERDLNQAYQLLGLGLYLASAIGDKKRELDILLKCQYALYETFEQQYLNVGLSLASYILSQEPDYETGKIWAQFQEGNIYIDLGNQHRFKEKHDIAASYFEMARDKFQSALKPAIKKEFYYAIITMYERLGVAYNRLKDYKKAKQSFEESLKIAETTNIKSWLVQKNKVRCLIGLGNINVDCQTHADKDKAHRDAEEYYKEACELAHRINYNEKIVLQNLANLFKEKQRVQEADCIGQLVKKV